MATRFSEPISRREMLKLVGAGSAGVILAACQPKVIEVTKEVEVPVEVEKTVVVEQTVMVEQEVVVEATPVFPLEQGELKILLCCSGPEDIENRQKWNTSWEAAHPGVKIIQDTVPAGQNYFEKLQTLIAADTMPDCYDMWEGYIQPYAENGALMNMDPFFEADPLVDKEDLVPAAFDGGSWQGSVYAFCQGFMPGPISLFFNVDHFDAAGLEYPTDDWTWDDMRAAALQLTNVPTQWGLTYSLWFVPWLYWIWSNGGDLFNEDETKCALTEPAAYEALQYWADMVLVDKTTLPSAEQQAMGGPTNAFVTGSASMYLGNCWDVGTLMAAREEGTVNWKGVLSPKAPNGKRVWYEHFWCWGIWPKTKMPNAAWLMCRDFILDQVNQQAQPMVPPLKQLLPIFDTEQNRELGFTSLIALATEPGLLRYPGAGAKFDKISQLVQAEIDLVFLGEKTAKEAAEAVCPVVDEELART
jgi:ABC-type glycerol-3-phosphate transport system substrate-binding protein